MENLEELTADEWVPELQQSLIHLPPAEFDAEIAGNLVEIINAFNNGRTPKETAERILKQV